MKQHFKEIMDAGEQEKEKNRVLLYLTLQGQYIINIKIRTGKEWPGDLEIAAGVYGFCCHYNKLPCSAKMVTKITKKQKVRYGRNGMEDTFHI